MKLFIFAILIFVSQSNRHKQLFDVLKNDKDITESSGTSVDAGTEGIEADNINMMEKSHKKFEANSNSVFGDATQEPITNSVQTIVKETITTNTDDQNANLKSNASLLSTQTEVENSALNTPEEEVLKQQNTDSTDPNSYIDVNNENQQNEMQIMSNQQTDLTDLEKLRSEIEVLQKESESLQKQIDETKSETKKKYEEKTKEIKNFILKVDDKIEGMSKQKVDESQKLIKQLSIKESDLNHQILKGQSFISQTSSNYKKLEESVHQLNKELENTDKTINVNNASLKGKLNAKGNANFNALNSDHISVGSIKFDLNKMIIPSSVSIEIGSHEISPNHLIKIHSEINDIIKKCKSAFIGCIFFKENKVDKKDMISNLESIKRKLRNQNQIRSKSR